MLDTRRSASLGSDVSVGRRDSGRPGLALVVLSVVEQRLDAVRAALSGVPVVEVAARYEVSRQSVHTWMGRYLVEGVAGLADRSHRPHGCPHRAPSEVEVRVTEMRREHPRWGAKRIRMELLRKPCRGRVRARGAHDQPDPVTPRSVGVAAAEEAEGSPIKRFQRPCPMQLWQIDIVGGIWLVDPATGELREAKVVTGVDDYSRFCVMATVVERATGRAVCLAFAEAIVRFGVPEEVLTDNGKQFTDRFGKAGEVLFDKICRKNGITHRLTAPASPNQNGKVERFHGTFRPDFLAVAGPFTSHGGGAGCGGCVGGRLQHQPAAPGARRPAAGDACATVRTGSCRPARVVAVVASRCTRTGPHDPHGHWRGRCVGVRPGHRGPSPAR